MLSLLEIFKKAFFVTEDILYSVAAPTIDKGIT